MFREDVNLTSHGMILLFLLLYLGLVNALNTTCHAGSKFIFHTSKASVLFFNIFSLLNFAEEIRNDFDWKFSRELTCGDFCVNVS